MNSPFRKTLIANHLRFIEWPQLHGDANKYWASLGPQVRARGRVSPSAVSP